MKKKLTAMILAAAMAVTGLFTAMTPEKANAAEWEACDIPVIKEVSEFDAVSAMYSKTITVTTKDKNIEQGYGSFQLKSDSWVILKTTSSLVTSQEDGHQTHIEVFSDASASNKVLQTGDGYWEYDGDQYTILKKGTYYFHTKSSCQNYDTFTGNINVVAAAIPTSKLIQTGVKKNSKKTSATVSFSNVLGTHVRAVQCQKGNIGKSHNEDKKYWKQYIISGMYSGEYDLAKGKSPKFVTEKGEKYSFKVKKNGKYTIWISDDKGNIYTKAITVKGLKK